MIKLVRSITFGTAGGMGARWPPRPSRQARASGTDDCGVLAPGDGAGAEHACGQDVAQRVQGRGWRGGSTRSHSLA